MWRRLVPRLDANQGFNLEQLAVIVAQRRIEK
jgi:hypothetical protein